MLQPGTRIPDAVVWVAPRRRASLHELLEDRRALLLFYLFDWSST